MQVLEGKTHYLEFFGNLLPVTKSGDQLSHKFYAFRENRLPFNVRVRDPNNDAVGKPTTWDIISESVLEIWIRGIRMFFSPSGSRSISQMYGSGSFPFLIRAVERAEIMLAK